MCVRLTECACVCNFVPLFVKCKRFLTIYTWIRRSHLAAPSVSSPGPCTFTMKIQPIEERRKNGESDFLCDLSLSKRVRMVNCESNNENVGESTPHSSLIWILMCTPEAQWRQITDVNKTNTRTRTVSTKKRSSRPSPKYMVDKNSSKAKNRCQGDVNIPFIFRFSSAVMKFISLNFHCCCPKSNISPMTVSHPVFFFFETTDKQAKNKKKIMECYLSCLALAFEFGLSISKMAKKERKEQTRKQRKTLVALFSTHFSIWKFWK